jgi:hypothetical protein
VLAVTVETIRTFLPCPLGRAYAPLLAWFAVFVFFHDGLHRLHGRWFRLPVETSINDGGMAVYKIAVLLLFAIPWLALGCVD